MKWRKLKKPLMYGEDNCLILLKDVCTKVVESYINGLLEQKIDSILDKSN
ncbi:MAG: hypothetical protein IIC75_00535 [Bacteroidetes bacterium]|nr:hypothetical protein [Bacteroidota bacterium]